MKTIAITHTAIRLLWLSGYAFFLIGCSTLPMVEIESTNQSSRINSIVIHTTSENFSESLRLLTTPTSNPVSSHYLIPTLADATYKPAELSIYRLVSEQQRAWHAGVSRWGSQTSLNDRSIGIEIVNEFKCNENTLVIDDGRPQSLECTFPSFDQQQIDLLIALLKDILSRNPEIPAKNIVAHSDIAIFRKSDPGPLFPWQQLHAEGIGAWPDAEDVSFFLDSFETELPSVSQIQRALAIYGYGVEVTGEFDIQSSQALRAFQLHFRPSNYDGQLDAETSAVLWALLKKYDNSRMGGL